VHAPGTKLNDQYVVTDQGDAMEQFCKKLEDSDVHVFGIADYFSADAYFAFIAKFRTLYPHSSKVFFPNVELRFSYVVNAAQEEVNVHIIFNPLAPKFEELLRKFLQHLKTNKTNAGGARVKVSDLSKSDCEEATTTREFLEEAFREVYGGKSDLTDYLLIFTAANNDGIRPVRGKKRKLSITDELDKFSNGFFGNSSNVEYFLNCDRLEGDEAIDAKPVVSGCDAHSFNDLDAWLGKRVLKDGVVIKEPTWVKGDLTFEGLKYLTYEPQERALIGEEPDIVRRVRANQTKYIKTLGIGQNTTYDGKHGFWFKGEEMAFNPGLVAIIGNKGSGKSAVTDIIGLIGNTHNQKIAGASGHGEELFSFLNKEKFLKGRCASNFRGELYWHAGDPDERTLDQETDEDLPEKVEYLPQKYLEKICANIEDDEFRSKLNEVIFGYVKEEDRFGKTNLDDLIGYLTSQTEEDIKQAKIALHDANEKVVVVEQKLAPEYKRSIEEKKRVKSEEIETHNKIKPAEVLKPDTTGSTGASEIDPIDKEMESLKAQISGLEFERVGLNKKVQDFGQIKHAIQRQVEGLSGLKTKYAAELSAAGIKFEEVISLAIDYSKIDEHVRINNDRLVEIKLLLQAEEVIDTLGLDDADKKAAQDKSLRCRYARLEKSRQDISDRLDKPSRDYQAYVEAKEKWDTRYNTLVGDAASPAIDTLKWLERELTAISSQYPSDLTKAREERKKQAKDLLGKKMLLATFYDSVKKSIDSEIAKNAGELGDYELTIEASLRLNHRSFYDDFFRFINQNVKGSFNGAESGRGVLKALVEEVMDWQDQAATLSFTESVVAHIDNDQRKDLSSSESRTRDVFKQMKQNKNPVDFYDFLFGFDYLETKYDLKVDDKDLSELSPGERGGLLLIFYLMLDRRDIPLVIDQPEDNLDNESVYEILVTFLKKAKKRRQIIMVTHNPNLAVVADAEQVIHVSIDKNNKNDFSFCSGAIENPEINKRVVDILEGTLPAFDNRKLKYRRAVI
jgi:ABC-type lipoprotein export system ATPase subunit